MALDDGTAAPGRGIGDRLARAPGFVVALGLAFALFIIATTAIVSWNAWRQEVAATERLTRDLARLFEAHTARLLDAGDLALREATELAEFDSFEQLALSQEKFVRLRNLAHSLDFVQSIWIGDALGDAVLSSLAFPAPSVSVADRDFFIAHRERDRGLYVGRQAPSLVGGQPVINLSRGLYDGEGRFRGFVDVAVFVGYFDRISSELGIPNLSVELVRADDAVILQIPPSSAAPQRSHFPIDPKQTLPVTTIAASRLDGIPRIHTAMPVKSYPMIVDVGVRQGSVASAWRARVRIYFLLALGALLAVGCLTALAWRRARNEALIEAELRNSERRFRAVFNNTLQFIGLVEPNGTVIEINRSALDFIGETPETVRGRKFWELSGWESAEATRSGVQRAVERAAAGETVRYDVTIAGASGQQAAIDFSIKPVRDGTGAIVMLLPEGRDITEQKHAEAIALQAQKMEAVGHLTGGVAHDFNNLLTVILGNVEMIRRRTRDALLARSIEAIERAAHRGETLTRQLLAFSRRQPLRPEPVDVASRIRGMQDMLERSLRGDIRVELLLPKDLWPVEVDPAQFELALLNIAVNARDAMPGGGIIRVEAANEMVKGALSEAMQLAGPFVRLSVSDSGSGIDPAILDRVFEPFFTTKDVGKGTGLGLSQVYGFAKQSGGHATIDSMPGRGTTVTLWLPRAGAAAAGSTDAPAQHRRAAS